MQQSAYYACSQQICVLCPLGVTKSHTEWMFKCLSRHFNIFLLSLNCKVLNEIFRRRIQTIDAKPISNKFSDIIPVKRSSQNEVSVETGSAACLVNRLALKPRQTILMFNSC